MLPLPAQLQAIALPAQLELPTQLTALADRLLTTPSQQRLLQQQLSPRQLLPLPQMLRALTMAILPRLLPLASTVLRTHRLHLVLLRQVNTLPQLAPLHMLAHLLP